MLHMTSPVTYLRRWPNSFKNTLVLGPMVPEGSMATGPKAGTSWHFLSHFLTSAWAGTSPALLIIIIIVHLYDLSSYTNVTQIKCYYHTKRTR